MLSIEYYSEVFKSLPVIGVSHILGERFHLLSNIVTKDRRRGREEINGSVLGNVLISFNNSKAEEIVTFLNSVKSSIKVRMKEIFGNIK